VPSGGLIFRSAAYTDGATADRRDAENAEDGKSRERQKLGTAKAEDAEESNGDARAVWRADLQISRVQRWGNGKPQRRRGVRKRPQRRGLQRTATATRTANRMVSQAGCLRHERQRNLTSPLDIAAEISIITIETR